MQEETIKETKITANIFTEKCVGQNKSLETEMVLVIHTYMPSVDLTVVFVKIIDTVKLQMWQLLISHI